MVITPKNSIIMFDFVEAQSKRLKIIKSTRRRFSSHQYQWRKHENIRHWIILIKLIYVLIFVCFTISICLNQSIDENIDCSRRIFVRIWDIWFSFLGLILILSLLIDHLKRQNRIPLKIINFIQISLIISFIIFMILGHIQGYYRLWWSSSLSIELTRSTFLSIVFIDICPISIAIIITINALKKRRSCRRVHVNTIISSV